MSSQKPGSQDPSPRTPLPRPVSVTLRYSGSTVRGGRLLQWVRVGALGLCGCSAEQKTLRRLVGSSLFHGGLVDTQQTEITEEP